MVQSVGVRATAYHIIHSNTFASVNTMELSKCLCDILGLHCEPSAEISFGVDNGLSENTLWKLSKIKLIYIKSSSRNKGTFARYQNFH